jgi:hypothetical protein
VAEVVAAWMLAYLAIIWLVIALTASRGPPVGSVTVLAAPAIVGIGARLVLVRNGTPQHPGCAPYRTIDGALVGYGGERARSPDREERVARKALARHRINRFQYERVLARRHLVHGEFDRREYQSIIDQLTELERERSATAARSR